MDLDQDRQQLQLAQSGDERALDALIRAHHAWAVRLAYSLLRDHASAEDAVQEAWIQAVDGLAACRGEHGFAPWFSVLVRRCALREARHRRPASAAIRLPVRGGIVDPWATYEDAWDMWALVARLRPVYRDVVFLRYAYDLSEAEIAQHLRCPVGTVKSRLHYARGHLADLFRQGGWKERWSYE